jgi:thiol:disulfide interchange protein
MFKFAHKAFLHLAAAVIFSSPVIQAQMLALYSDTADARQEIQQALVTARHEHKRVILDFGGNWCGDCKVLDLYLHQQPNLDLLQQNFVLVHVNIGHYDRNTDLAEKYEIPLKLGVPALAVLDAQGRLLFSQKHREFEKMYMVTPDSVRDFLNTWKPKKKV